MLITNVENKYLMYRESLWKTYSPNITSILNFMSDLCNFLQYVRNVVYICKKINTFTDHPNRIRLGSGHHEEQLSQRHHAEILRFRCYTWNSLL